MPKKHRGNDAVLKSSVVLKEIESDPDLMKMIECANKDIATGNLYTTEEIIEAIEREEI